MARKMAQMEASRTHEFELQQPPSDGISRVRFVRDSHLLLTSSWDGVRDLPKISNFTSPLMFCGAGREALRCCTERVEGSVLAQGWRLPPFRLAFILLSFKSFYFPSRLPCSTWRRLADHTPSPPAWTEGSSCTHQPATSQHKMFSFLALSKHSSEAACRTRASHTAVRRHDWTTQTESIFGTHEKAVRCLEYSEPQGSISHHSWPASDLLLTPARDCSFQVFCSREAGTARFRCGT